VLGRQVPDERSLGERLRRPTPAVRTRGGRIAYGFILLALFGSTLWGSQSLLSVVFVVGLFACSLIVIAVDSRRFSDKFYKDR
jgi:hypothetical protein